MENKYESPERGENQIKLSHMAWTEAEATRIGQFLTRKDSEPSSNKSRWEDLTFQTKYETPYECAELLTEAKKFLAFYPEMFAHESESDNPRYTQDEYEFVAKKRALTSIEILLSSREKIGLADNNYLRFDAYSSVRDKNKKNFAQEEHFGSSQLEAFAKAEDGGPDVVERIGIPPSTNDRSDGRMRASIIHEIGHITRGLVNRAVWEGKNEQALQSGLKQNKAASTEAEAIEERKYIGGFRVGSSQQGAEATGELLTAVVLSLKPDSSVTLGDIQPYLQKRLISGIKKFEKAIETSRNTEEKINSDYFVARFNLFHHVTQLIELGYENIDAIEFAALASAGYVSLEKAPDLIGLQVIDHGKVNKTAYMLRNVIDYLTSDDLEGYLIP